MRYPWTISLLLLPLLVSCQIGSRIDPEYEQFCFVDSIGPGNQVRFTRLLNVATMETIDIRPDQSSSYTPAGTLIPCDLYDLRVTIPTYAPIGLDDCDCIYVADQEGHEVVALNGGATQTYEVEFQGFVDRTCGPNGASIEVYRDTLTLTEAVDIDQAVQWTFPDDGYIDNINLVAWSAIPATQSVVGVDLNPSTVLTTYPGLVGTIDTADLRYDAVGGNIVAMAAAVETVVNHAIDQDRGGSTTNSVTAQGLALSTPLLQLRLELFHQPSGIYAVVPYSGDSNYAISGVYSTLKRVDYNAGTLTTTSAYETGCGTVRHVESAFYLEHDTNNLRQLSVRAAGDQSRNVATANVNHNPSRTCDSPDELCANTQNSSVSIAGCVTLCEEECAVTGTPGHVRLNAGGTTLAADTYHSIAFVVLSGTVTVTIDGVAITYPAGFSSSWTAPEDCSMLDTAITLSASEETIISTLR